MTVLHSGSNKKFAAGWESIFAGRKPARTAGSKAAPRAAKRAAGKKKVIARAGKKRSAK